MNNRERLLKTLNHKQPDRCPYHILFTKAAEDKMAEFYGDADFKVKLGNCFTLLRARKEDSFKEIFPNIWQDEFGVHWNRTVDKDIGTVCNQVITKENVAYYQFPDPDDEARYSDFSDTIAGDCDGFYVMNLGFSLFERAWTLVGMENVLMAMAADKKFINTLLDRILEYNLRIIENGCRFNIDAFVFGDDWGQQNGLLMGPTFWREFIKPRIRQMYQAAKSGSKFVFIHSCGKIQEILPDLIECGLDVFNPFQPEVMDVFEIKKRFGESLSFFGGISVQKTLPFGTTAQTKDEVKFLIDKVGKNGGYIASPSHAIPADAKPENIAAMIEILQNQ